MKTLLSLIVCAALLSGCSNLSHDEKRNLEDALLAPIKIFTGL